YNIDICHSKEIIEEILGSAFVSFYYIDTYVDTNVFKKPIMKTIKSKATILSLQLFKRIFLNYGMNIVRSDNGFLFSDYQIFTEPTVNEIVPDFSGPVKSYAGDQVLYEFSN